MLLAVIAAPFGPVAQLGAHYIRIVGVVGSNPIRSTKKKTPPVWVVFFLFLFAFSQGVFGLLHLLGRDGFCLVVAGMQIDLP